MSPLRNQLHVDKLLSNVSVQYRQTELIGLQVFPQVPVKMESDKYRVYVRNMRIPETKRADGGVAKESHFEVTTNTYQLERHSLRDIVTDRQAENFDIGDLRVDTTEDLTSKLLSRVELQVAQLFTSTNWSLNVSLAAASQWNNTTTADPVPQFMTGASTVILQGGMKPNFGILPRDCYVAAKSNSMILERLKYTTSEIDVGKLGAMFDLPQLLVPAAGYDTSQLGATSTITAFWGDNAFMGWKPASPGPKKPSSGYVFRNVTPMVKRYRDEEREGEFIEVNIEYSPRIIASLSGYLIKDVLA